MESSNFVQENEINYEQKCLCVLVLDVSDSMRTIIGGDIRQTGTGVIIDGRLYEIVESEGIVMQIDELNKGLQNLHNEILSDETTRQRFELSLITFSDIVKTMQEPALVENFSMPTLKANGKNASMVEAVNTAIEKVQARKNFYKATNQNYYRPWIILITDSEPDSNQDVFGLARRISSDMEKRKYVFLAINIGGANMDTLERISGLLKGKKMGPMMLKDAKFSSFFQWLDDDVPCFVHNEEGQTVNIPDDWLKDFLI